MSLAYVGNESDADVFFDDTRVEHRQGLQVQENQYDPVGLELAGLGASTPGLKPLNRYRWNGKEFQADLGLNWTQLDWRMFDPQLDRLPGVDPEVENGQESMSPYAFGFDNALRFNDPNGRCPGGCPPTPGVQPDLLNRMVLGIGVSLVNLQGQMWAGILGTQTKYAADYVYDASGTAVDYTIGKVPVGTDKQEMKAFAADEFNLLTLAVGGEGKAFEQAGGRVVAAEVVQEAKSVGPITGYTKHGLNQAIGRNGGKGVNAQAMTDAVANPKKVVSQLNGTTKYAGKDATVVTNGAGKVVTTFGKARGPRIQAEGRSTGGGAAQRRAVQETQASYNPKAIR